MPAKVLTQTQLLHVARMDANATDAKTIALATGLTKHVVDRILEGETLNDRQRLEFDSARAQALQQIHSAEIQHGQRMSEMVDTAYDAIEFAMDNMKVNPELAAKTAWKVLLNTGVAVVDEKVLTAGNTANTQVNVYQSERTDNALTVTIKAIAAATETMSPLGPLGEETAHFHVPQAETVSVSSEHMAPAEPDPESASVPEGTPDRTPTPQSERQLRHFSTYERNTR